MKLINKYKSLNFNKRSKKKICFIIIHYTALKNYNAAINYLCDPKNKVSTHFLISQNGNIFKLVNENMRAWHAGVSFWNDHNDINALSIGIELDYSYFKSNNKFSNKMINSLIYLLKKLMKKYKIKNTNVLGHSDIAPFRKIDPGPKFPWFKLYKENLAFDPAKHIKNYQIKSVNIWFRKNRIFSDKKRTLFMLAFLGYDTHQAQNNYLFFKKLLFSYQNHFIQKNLSGKLDKVTLNFIIQHFINYLLTTK
tara:strand:- start:64 stop:816 length:753 start_codon:yes stop_codon:yes gene_type:complete